MKDKERLFVTLIINCVLSFQLTSLDISKTEIWIRFPSGIYGASRRLRNIEGTLVNLDKLIEMLSPWAEAVKESKNLGKKPIILFDLTGTLKKIGKGEEISRETLQLLSRASQFVDIGIVSGAGIAGVTNDIINSLPAGFNQRNLILYALLGGVVSEFDVLSNSFKWRNVLKITPEQEIIIDRVAELFRKNFSGEINPEKTKWELGNEGQKICYAISIKPEVAQVQLDERVAFLSQIEELKNVGVNVELNRPINKIFLTLTNKSTVRNDLNTDVFPHKLRIGVGDSAFDRDMVGEDSIFIYVGIPKDAPKTSVILSRTGPAGTNMLLEAILKLLQ